MVIQTNVTVVMCYKWIGTVCWVGLSNSRFFVGYYRKYCTDYIVVVVVKLVIVGLWSNRLCSTNFAIRMKKMGRKMNSK